MPINTFYNEILTDHNMHPAHKYNLDDANLVLEGVNPSCGDDIVLQLKMNEDGVIEERAVVDLAVLDKRVQVGAGAVVGHGENLALANKQFPKHLYTGISLVGKEAKIPKGTRIGRNCIVSFGYNDDAFSGQNTLADGESA